VSVVGRSFECIPGTDLESITITCTTSSSSRTTCLVSILQMDARLPGRVCNNDSRSPVAARRQDIARPERAWMGTSPSRSFVPDACIATDNRNGTARTGQECQSLTSEIQPFSSLFTDKVQLCLCFCNVSVNDASCTQQMP
jgi:hypothetical protein